MEEEKNASMNTRVPFLFIFLFLSRLHASFGLAMCVFDLRVGVFEEMPQAQR
jgi:hypothetical protein